MTVDVKELINKLNAPCKGALEKAAGLCVSETHYNVEVEHFLVKLIETPDLDFAQLLSYYEVDTDAVLGELAETMGDFKRGNSRTPTLAPQISLLLEEGWLRTTLHLKSEAVRSGALLLALLENDTLRGIVVESVPSLLKVPLAPLRQDVREIVKGSAEDGAQPTAPTAKSSPKTKKGKRGGKSATPALDQYTVDLTARAEAGEIDPIRGRDGEIRQIIDVLSRRRQNNPILTGEAGVGKTAVVEGFALRVAAGDVPPALESISLRILDLGLLQAGAGVKGEFENRLKSVIAEVSSSPSPIILFIDEAHTLIGAGGQAGQGDAANLLKPALARGELRTIAATTWTEYKKYFEKDPALARRFQVVKVEEPDADAAIDMLRGVAPYLERHHGVRVMDAGVRDAVLLSQRYIAGRQLPDKAISVLDTACARVAIAHSATPPAVEDVIRQLERVALETAILERERGPDDDRAEERDALEAEAESLKGRRLELDVRWQEELEIVREIHELGGHEGEEAADEEGEEDDAPDPGDEDRRRRLVALTAKLEALQGDEPMVPAHVDGRVVAAVVAGWTGIPIGRMMTDEIDGILSLRERLEERIIGQPQALETLCRRLTTSRANLDDPAKPAGVFLLAGPSGVGKTETAFALADLLFGGERNLVVINMSEYQEAHTVSGLKGSPPGYVGYGTGGALTEAVRRHPYSVVLLDEMEKAHPDVVELFYQVFDKGVMEDAEGVTVDFKNTVILLTSNLGGEIITQLSRSGATAEEMGQAVRPELLDRFRPALLGRLVVVPYRSLGDEEIRTIVELKLAHIQDRVEGNHRVELTYGEELVTAIAARCTEVDSGARNVDHILTNTLLPGLATRFLERMAAEEETSGVHVSLDDSGDFAYRFWTRGEG